MSIQASSWAWSVPDLKPRLRLTLLAIADSCNHDGYGFPGQARLAEMVGCSERQIRTNVSDLEKLGLLTVAIRPGSGKGRCSNGYQLAMKATGSTLPIAGATGSTLPDGQPEVFGGATGSFPSCAPYYIEPLVEPSCANASCDACDCDDATTDDFTEFWDLYPKKKDKKKARTAWKRLSSKKRRAAMEHLRRRPFRDTDNRFVPYPSTYINGERWEDEPDPGSNSSRTWAGAI